MSRKLTIPFIVCALLACISCSKEDNIIATNQNLCLGAYSPLKPIKQVNIDHINSGVAILSDTISDAIVQKWYWNNSKLSFIEYTNNLDSASWTEQYYYNESGRLERLAVPNNRYLFKYSANGRLWKIEDSDRFYITFDYPHYGHALPTAMYITRSDAQGHATTMGWMLEWDNANLVRATADDTALFYTGISYYEYIYDDHSNPYQGFINNDMLTNDLIIEYPSCFSKNNIVSTIRHYDHGNGTESTNTTSYHHDYADDLPSVISHFYHNIATYSTTEITRITY